jgi:hypothetical protein
MQSAAQQGEGLQARFKPALGVGQAAQPVAARQGVERCQPRFRRAEQQGGR